jgi:hypothetical protein
MLVEEQSDVFNFDSIQIYHIAHALRQSVLMVFIVDIAKWHSRITIPLIFVILFTD